MSQLIDLLNKRLDAVATASPFALPAAVSELAAIVGAILRHHENRLKLVEERRPHAMDVVL